MNPRRLQRLFPNASQSTIRRNADLEETPVNPPGRVGGVSEAQKLLATLPTRTREAGLGLRVLSDRFVGLWKALGGTELVPEHRFDPDRKWMFDFADLKAHVAIEIEGGVYRGGRHQTFTGFLGDGQKYLIATLRGWTVFRLPSPMIRKEFVEPIVDFAKGARIEGVVVEPAVISPCGPMAMPFTALVASAAKVQFSKKKQKGVDWPRSPR